MIWYQEISPVGLPLANYHGRAEQKNPKLPFCVKLDRRQQACQISNEGFPVLRQIAHVQGDQCSLHLGTQQKYIYNHINSNVYYLIICICTYIYIYLCVCTNHALLVIIMSKKILQTPHTSASGANRTCWCWLKSSLNCSTMFPRFPPRSRPPDGWHSKNQASEMHKSVHDSYLQCLVESHHQHTEVCFSGPSESFESYEKLA